MQDRPRPLASYRHVERLPVLGVPTAFACDHPGVIGAIRDAYGAWASYGGLDPAPAGAGGADPVVEVEVRPVADVPPPGPGGPYRLPEPGRLAVAVPGAAGRADAASGRARAVVTEALVADGARLVQEVVEPLTLFLLGWRDRQPVHAAGIVRDGAAILLAGPSGTGKSTLAYAARAHGFSVLADEPVYVQLEPRLRVWGRGPRLHLRPDVRARFPELRDREPVRLPTGKTKLVVDAGAGPRCADRAALCLLRRDPRGAARLEGLDPAAAVEALTADLDPGFDLFADTIGARIARVAEGGSWLLFLSDDPRDALPLLEEVAARPDGSP